MMKLGNALDGSPVNIDIEKLVEGRLLAQANSGGGKSWLLRRLLEQTAGKIQHIIIDVEDEFHTLREKHDYILAGRDGGDCPADRRSAELLARRLLELGMSAVISIYEMKPGEREEFVRLFLESLISAPRSLWHPALIVIDEAHMFAPEGGKSETTGAVVDLMARGRKRGYAGVLATQRISKINKDAIAEVNNKLIGRAALDIDMKRAADELGFSEKAKQLYLRTLPAGRFFAFGPALSMNVVEMEVGPVLTTHPKAGQRSAPATPPPNKVRAVLEQLANLPKEAEEQARTMEEAQKRIRTLERDLKAAQLGKATTEDLQKKYQEGLERGRLETKSVEVSVLTDEDRQLISEASNFWPTVSSALGHLHANTEKVSGLLNRVLAGGLNQRPAPKTSPPVHRMPAPVHKQAQSVHRTSGPSGLPVGEKSVLIAVAQFGSVVRPQLTTLTGYARSSRDAYIQRLSAKGFARIEGDKILATEDGIAALGSDFEPLPTGVELQRYWLGRLPSGEAAVLKVLLDAYPHAVEPERISEATTYARSSRDAYLQRLSSKELAVRERGGIRANANLFD